MNEKSHREIFSNNLKALLNNKNLSQQEVAKNIGVSSQTFNTWYQGIALPRMEKIQALANYFKITKSDLIEESEPKEYSTDNLKILPIPQAVRVPLLGTISEGNPITAYSDIEGFINIPTDWLNKHNEYIALKVQGDSMLPEYRDGDTIIVKRQEYCNNGQIAVVLVDDEVTIKKVRKQGKNLVLQPLNPEYELIFCDTMDCNIKIYGIPKIIQRRV